MKNKIILLLVAVIFLSSCANKYSLTKRKYTKGYYFASSKNRTSTKNEINPTDIIAANLPAKKSTQLNETNIKTEVVLNTPNEFVKIATKPVSSNENKSTHKIIASTNNKTNFETKTTFKPLAEKQNYKTNLFKKDKSDENFIIMVILCLVSFINLIPVFLHDSKNLTLNFWVTLILDCLFFLPGIIFALLVVLDILDLD